VGCSNCGNRTSHGLPGGCKNNGACGSYGCNKLDVFDWLSITTTKQILPFKGIEVRFKNTRKEYFYNIHNLHLKKGNIVVTDSKSGYDVGIISLTGELVRAQLKKNKIKTKVNQLPQIKRVADQKDIDKWIKYQEAESIALKDVLKLVSKSGLKMKISDLEFQGDGNKAFISYTAETRVDFRELIRKLADKLKVKVEMKQIRPRQEAGLIGAIGSCGRELCCSTWLTNFRSVNTSAARYQQLSINPTKLSGLCGKLKCCLNFELDGYLDAFKTLPKSSIKLKTKKGIAFHQKTDVFKQKVWYSYKDEPHIFIPLEAKTVLSIIEKNKKGEIPMDLNTFQTTKANINKFKAVNMEIGNSNIKLTEPKKKKKKFFKKRKPKKKNP